MVYAKFLCFLIIYLIQSNYFKISGTLLAHGYSCDLFNRQSSQSSTGATFEIDVNTTNDKQRTKNYKLETWSDVKLYKINPKIKCTKVKFGDKEVWTHERCQNQYPEYVRYLKGDNKVEVDFKGGVTKTFKQDGENWKEETGATNPGSNKDAGDRPVNEITNKISSGQCGWFSCLSSCCRSKSS